MNNRWLNLSTFITMLVVNVLATIGKINHTTPGSISDQFPISFTPAGYAFSIWSLIYLLLLVLFIWSVSVLSKFTKAAVHQSYTFALSCLFNIAWIFAWHYKVIWLSWIFIVGLLVTLIVLNHEIQKTTSPEKTWLENWLDVYPFQIYYGWIIVAVIANTCILLFSFGFKSSFLGIGAEIWTVILILVAFILTWFITFVKNFKAIVCVFMWAVLAIAVKNYKWKMAGAEITQFASKGNLLIVIIALVAVLLMMKSYMDQYFCLKSTCECSVQPEQKMVKKAKKK
ncbi:MAG: tryptophan-rich sensory protein [Caldisericia bacterium]|nr:tryptophan-rich sensory protein [Caldisericia bacterium]